MLTLCFQVDLNNELQRLYSGLLQPFIDVYVTTAQNLHRLEDRQVHYFADFLLIVFDYIFTGSIMLECRGDQTFNMKTIKSVIFILKNLMLQNKRDKKFLILFLNRYSMLPKRV